MKHHAVTAAILATLTAAALATPSGLNNIPTADAEAQGVFVLQTFSTVGNDRDADLNLGFKTGVNLGPAKLELGFASHLLPDKGGPFAAHAKLAYALGENLPTLAVGVVNVTFDSDDRDRAGDEFAYAVATHDLGWFRIHGGVGTQDGDALPFFGVDKTFRRAVAKPADGKTMKGTGGKAVADTEWRDILTVRADAIYQHDETWLYSAGVLVPVCSWFVFETWGNFPDNGDDASLTLKANFVFKF